MTQTEEQIMQIIEGWKENENVISNTIVREGDDIIAHGMVVRNQNNSERAGMGHISIYKEGKEYLRLPIFKYLINKAKETGLTDVTLNTANDVDAKIYKDRGLKFQNFYRHEIKL